MINGLEGIPGSGKSYEAVVYHVLHYVKKGRKVITNLPLDLDAFAAIDPSYLDLIELRTASMPVLGTWDADATPAFQIQDAPESTDESPFAGVKIRRKLFGSVWDFYSDWQGKDGEGPVFIIDECHVGMPKIGTNSQVIEWFKLHRHFNSDVLLCTQSFRDVCPEISGLLAMLIKVRKADILGKKGCYIRKVHGGYRGAVISTDERPYHAQYFALYKSHTQGNSVAESSAVDVVPFIVKWRRFSWFVMGVGVLMLISLIYSKTSGAPKGSTKTVTTTKGGMTLQTVTVENPPALKPAASASSPNAPGENTAVQIPEPYESKGFHLTGRASMGDKVLYMFSVSQNGLPVSNVTHKDLERTGYRWVGLTDCAGTLFWQEKAIPVTCDAPQISLAAANPIAPGAKGVPAAAN